MYMDRLGRLKELKGWKRVSDRLQGFIGGLRRFRIDQLSDHSSPGYIDNIFNVIRAEENKPESKYAKSPVSSASGTAGTDSQSNKTAADESSRQMSA
jgi:hypothetical protein